MKIKIVFLVISIIFIEPICASDASQAPKEAADILSGQLGNNALASQEGEEDFSWASTPPATPRSAPASQTSKPTVSPTVALAIAEIVNAADDSSKE